MSKRIITLLVSLIILTGAVSGVSATKESETAATEYTDSAVISLSTGAPSAELTDGRESTYLEFPKGSSITVTGEGIEAVYVKFHLSSKKWSASSASGVTEFGLMGYLHEYARLGETGGSFTMNLHEDTEICELRFFGEGTPPSDVQVWEPAFEKADVVLLSSHSDDEQLYLSGLIPHCAANDIDLQVVYFCYHDEAPVRLHEQLNGLWTAGATHYPALGIFPDLYSMSLAGAEQIFANYGYHEEDFVEYQCEIIRRFKPEIIVGHDVDGEYGHGTHMLNTKTLMIALELTADPANYPESAEKYGVWDVPKTYIHLYEERPIVMNYDIPLEHFGGHTAYEMSVKGFLCHHSQQWGMFAEWLMGTKEEPITAASQIEEYSPCEYGLYRTTVGDDKNGDMFENVTLRRDVPPETTAPETTAPDTTANTTATDALPSGEAGEIDAAEETKKIPAAAVMITVVTVVAGGGVAAFILRKSY